MRRSKRVVQAVFVLLPLALGGCAGAGLGEAIPQSLGGVPENAPKRTAIPAEFPAVHDMPASRRDRALSEDDQKRLEQDLRNIRQRQEGIAKTGS